MKILKSKSKSWMFNFTRRGRKATLYVIGLIRTVAVFKKYITSGGSNLAFSSRAFAEPEPESSLYKSKYNF